MTQQLVIQGKTYSIRISDILYIVCMVIFCSHWMCKWIPRESLDLENLVSE